MERKGVSSSSSRGLEWENLAFKPIEIQEQMCFSGSSHEAIKEEMDCLGRVGSFPPFENTFEDIFGMHKTFSSSGNCSSELPLIGLRLGDSSSSSGGSKFSVPVSSSTPSKRSRASYHNIQNPCCQVEGCNLDLKSAKDYHRRHRICESHSKSPKVVVAGMERRFCQQCSRFHELSEFDDKKRSCRRRLSDHNARRRRVQPESIQFASAGLSSALYADQRMHHHHHHHHQQHVLLNGLLISQTGTLDPTLCFSADEIRNLDPTRNIPDHCLRSNMVSAPSLLSSNPWSLNEREAGSSPMEGLVHGNYNPTAMRNSFGSESDLFQTQQNVNFPPDYHLFNSGGGFYSSGGQRNL